MSICPVIWAQALDAPATHAGDTWVYRNTMEKAPSEWRQTHDELSITRVTSSGIYYSVKPTGSTQPPRDSVAGENWTRSRSFNGEQTVVSRPLKFPLDIGKTWEVEFTEPHPDKIHRSVHMDYKYKVIGYEPVEVPAGKFDAVKIEAEGTWVAEMEPRTTAIASSDSVSGSGTAISSVQHINGGIFSGRSYKAFWYAPEVKRWVKSVEETYSSGDVRTDRVTTELESFKAAQQ